MSDAMAFFQNDFPKFLENRFIKTLVIIIIAYIINRLLVYAIKRLIKRIPEGSKRRETILKILRSLSSAVIFFIAVLQIMQVLFNINPTTIITATGVVGVAISFGAQGLVRDVISGFFILFENQYAVGDLVTIEDFMGEIESLGLRTTQIRNINGDLFTIPNGSITVVTNHSRGDRGILIDVGISYDSDINRAIDTLKDAMRIAKAEMPQLIKEPGVLGVSKLGKSGIQIRVFVNCKSGTQFEVEREMLRRIKYAFDEQNIKIPYNHLFIVSSSDKKLRLDKDNE